MELGNLKSAYMKNRLVLEKSDGSIELENEPIIEVNKMDFPDMVDIPQMISPSLRVPVALIGGGIILALASIFVPSTKRFSNLISPSSYSLFIS